MKVTRTVTNSDDHDSSLGSWGIKCTIIWTLHGLSELSAWIAPVQSPLRHKHSGRPGSTRYIQLVASTLWYVAPSLSSGYFDPALRLLWGHLATNLALH
jgi:hypothetical protein